VPKDVAMAMVGGATVEILESYPDLYLPVSGDVHDVRGTPARGASASPETWSVASAMPSGPSAGRCPPPLRPSSQPRFPGPPAQTLQDNPEPDGSGNNGAALQDHKRVTHYAVRRRRAAGT
jgi:hypothetical protein